MSDDEKFTLDPDRDLSQPTDTVLTPRQRRFAQLCAAGHTNREICEALGLTSSWVSTLQNNPNIRAEIIRLQEKIFAETVIEQLKDMREQALGNIKLALTDDTNRVKMSEKLEASKWVVEMTEGKATQKTDIGENLLGLLIDKLDAKAVSSASPRDVSSPDIETKALPAPPKDEDIAWIEDFRTESK